MIELCKSSYKLHHQNVHSSLNSTSARVPLINAYIRRLEVELVTYGMRSVESSRPPIPITVCMGAPSIHSSRYTAQVRWYEWWWAHIATSTLCSYHGIRNKTYRTIKQVEAIIIHLPSQPRGFNSTRVLTLFVQYTKRESWFANRSSIWIHVRFVFAKSVKSPVVQYRTGALLSTCAITSTGRNRPTCLRVLKLEILTLTHYILQARTVRTYVRTYAVSS